MDIKKLLSGIAIIIDDKIKKEDSQDLILKIRDQLKNHISILEYEDLPDNTEICNFKNISFILLDWQLFETPKPGMQIDELLFINNNIEFLKEIKKVGFTPVFIFSNQSPHSITRKLSDEGIYNEGSNNNYIFIKQKQDLFSDIDDNLLFAEIENWLKKTPSMYLLKEWEYSLNKAKRDLFWAFYEINPNWPSVLQKTFTDDGSDVNYELSNFIYKNLSARAKQITFDDDILNQEDDNISKEDIRKVLEAERFINNDNDTLPDKPCTGDLFEYECDVNGSIEKRYYLNIRPECDIAIRPDGTSNPELYCLKCRIINDDKIISEKLFDEGTLLEKINNTYIPFIDNGKIVEVLFNDLKIFNWEENLKDDRGRKIEKIFKETRIGRLLPPYITKVQQRYSSYLQRQGLPAIPEKAIK